MHAGRYRDLVDQLAHTVLDGGGETDPKLRRAVAQLAAKGSLGHELAPGTAIPGAIAPFVTKVAQEPFRVTDQDLATLRAAGYSEEAVFEIVVAASLGAGIARLERRLSAAREAARSGPSR